MRWRALKEILKAVDVWSLWVCCLSECKYYDSACEHWLETDSVSGKDKAVKKGYLNKN